MSILIDENTRVLVQGITGKAGSMHTGLMMEAGTNVVAGVTPGKGGRKVDGIPVFDTVDDAVLAEGPDVSVVFVPPPAAAEAVFEALEAQLRMVVCITEGVPVLDMIRLKSQSGGYGTLLLGPNCPGLISPGRSMVGIMPHHIFKPGRYGVISKSGTLTYEVVDMLSREGMGQSTCIGIGGDPVHGLTMVDCLKMFEDDPDTDKIVLIGEIGGREEEEAARYFAGGMKKPVVALVTGRSAPPEKKMGHAGALVSMGCGKAEDKIRELKLAGIPVCDSIYDIPGKLLSL